MTQTIPLDLRLAGRERPNLMPADAENLCARPENREVFDDVIERAANLARGGTEGRTRSYQFVLSAAKRICGGCPVRDACLQVHGRDYELGVVAGFTDQERADFYGDA